jgi:hypothetical protein
MLFDLNLDPLLCAVLTAFFMLCSCSSMYMMIEAIYNTATLVIDVIDVLLCQSATDWPALTTHP